MLKDFGCGENEFLLDVHCQGLLWIPKRLEVLKSTDCWSFLC